MPSQVPVNATKSESWTTSYDSIIEETVAALNPSYDPYQWDSDLMLRDFMFHDKYARWNESEGRRETYPEACARVVEFFKEHISQNYPAAFAHIPFNELLEGMLTQSAMPSMRVFQMAGPALKRCHVASYNCFSGETEYVTALGIRNFKDTVGTEQQVLCHDGIWRTAKVSQFGESKLNKITFRPGKQSRTSLRKVIYATADHGWMTTRGRIRDLKVGDCVLATGQAAPFDIEAWVAGFLFGDGTVQDDCAKVRLCGAKAGLLPYFEQTHCRVNYPPSAKSDPMVSWEKGKFADCKSLPEHPTPSWMLGYLAADGNKDSRQPQVFTSNPDVLPFLQKHSAELGIVVTGVSVDIGPTNYGPRAHPLQKIGIRPASSTVWKVVSIEETDRVEPVYCVTEPVTNTFTLADGLCSLNCAYIPLDGPYAFAELLYVLMQGTGVGFSVERQYVDKWPIVKGALPGQMPTIWDIEDTTEGWCKALHFAISSALKGRPCIFDYSKIRPQGARLHTKGGWASGPEPLKQLIEFVQSTIKGATGRRLTPLELHDMACMCGQIVQVGGVRRAALASLSDLDDEEMRTCKSGTEWLEKAPWRAMANNSAVYTTDVVPPEFDVEWQNLVEGGSGERGIFNRAVATIGRDASITYGTNPCFEIILAPRQFCNLSIAVARADDTQKSLQDKVRLATIWGTLQSTLTSFNPILPEAWKENCERDRLLGVDITGQRDCPLINAWVLDDCRNVVDEVNSHFADLLGINKSVAKRCVKPGGNSSQLLGVSSGLHARYAPYYIRRTRVGYYTPMGQYLRAVGMPWQPEHGQTVDQCSVMVVEWPIKSPPGAVCRGELSATDQLEFWRLNTMYWTDHNPSCTIYVAQHEWDIVKAWLKDNWSIVGGLSFLPKDDTIYPLAPYEEITREEYEARLQKLPELDFVKGLAALESEDETSGSQEFACVGGACDL